MGSGTEYTCYGILSVFIWFLVVKHNMNLVIIVLNFNDIHISDGLCNLLLDSK